MEILAAAEEGSNTFLHAGYLSGHPRLLRPSRLDKALNEEEPEVLSTEEAFRLVPKEKRIPGSLSAKRVVQLPAIMSGMFFLLLALYYSKRGLSGRLARAAAITVTTIFAACLLLPSQGGERAVWEGLGYANPELATTAIMHGLLSEAMMSAKVTEVDTTELPNWVLLPRKRLTDSEKHAIRNFHRDGWGRAFRVESLKKRQEIQRFRIRSAGADGRFDTADDQVLSAAERNQFSWDETTRVYYVRRIEGRLHVFLRRSDTRSHMLANSKLARRLTGARHWDVWREKELGKRMVADLERVFRKHSKSGQDILMVRSKKWGKLR